MANFQVGGTSEKFVQRCIYEALREVGILLFAFGPLDVMLSHTAKEDVWKAAVAMIVGAVFFFAGAFGGRRIADD